MKYPDSEIPDVACDPTTIMSHQQRKKNLFLSAPSSTFRASRNRPPLPNSVAQAGLSSTSGSGITSTLHTESLAGSSRTLDGPQIESPNQHSDRNTATPQRTTAAMMSDIEQLNISGGNFIQNISNNQSDPLAHVAFQSLPRSREAAFSASINLDNLSRRRCTQGTRVDTVAQIMDWVKENNPAKAPPVYWLTGLAGLGKTTIAYTICELLDEAQLPFVSFFCSLQLDSRNSKLLVTTLCRDLAEIYNSYAASVVSILETNSKVVDANLRIQINELLAKPWQTSRTERKDGGLPIPIVVVDALDECDRGCEFLEELLRVIRANRLVGIKFLVTSRTDPKIVDICKSFPPNAVCRLHEVNAVDVQNDIEKYLREALPEFKDEPDLALLSQRAGGLFIYATTVVRFISPSHTSYSVSEMRFHLRAMLNSGLLASHASSDERLLVDELYERIIGIAFQGAGVRATRLRILHTVICAQSRIDISVLADLANTDQGTVKRVVESLHAVLFVSPKDDCVYWYHASFPDFLCSRARARISLSLHRTQRPLEFDAFCDARAHHGVLALRCLSVMHQSLHFNMCNLPSSYKLDSEVPGLSASIDETLSLTLRYASRHWARHLLEALPPEDDGDDRLCSLKDFLDNKLLFWIEAMNLIGAKTECSSLLKDAEAWIERGTKCQPDLLAQLRDATNFAAFFAGSPASKSTPHLYISALSMWNQESLIWRNWKNRFRFIPSISLPRDTITIPLLTIHTNLLVSCMALSSDGNQVISGSKVWDTRTGEQLVELQGYTGSVTSVAFSPDGSQIMAGSWKNSVQVWDPKTGELLREVQGHSGSVTSVAFSPDCNRIVSGFRDRSVRVWDAKTGEQLAELQGHTGSVTSVAFSPHGKRIVCGFQDKSVRVWDAETGEQLSELKGHIDKVNSVAFSADGSRIVTGSNDKSVRVWDAKTGEQLVELQGHTGPVTSVAFSPDGNRIVSSSRDKSVLVWGAKTGGQLAELQGHTGHVTSVAFSPDGTRIISDSWDGSVRVWDAKTDQQPKGHIDDVNSVTSVAFSPDGNHIVSGSDNSVRVWDSKTGELLGKLQGHTYFVTSVAFSADDSGIVSGSLDQSVRVWDAKTGKQLAELQGHTNSVTSVAFSSDGTRIVSGSLDQSVRVWDAKTGEPLAVLQGHTDYVTSVAFSPDGNRIASGSREESVRVWDAKTGQQLEELRGHTSSVTSVEFSVDGTRIVSGSWDGSLRVWDAKSGKQLKELQGHTLWVTSVAFSVDGNRILSGSADRSVRVWDAKTGEPLAVLQGHTDYVTSVAFSSDGTRIVSGSSDQSVRVWSALNFNTSWAMEEDGWILSPEDSQMLVWVPSTISNILLRPPNTLIISRNGFATISFTQCKLGTIWHECYTP